MRRRRRRRRRRRWRRRSRRRRRWRRRRRRMRRRRRRRRGRKSICSWPASLSLTAHNYSVCSQDVSLAKWLLMTNINITSR
jgi:hypothetical protein